MRRALKSQTGADDSTLDSAIDAESIKSAVEEDGLQAVTDTGTLDDAINQDELGSPVDTDDVQSSVSDETEEFTGEQDQQA